MGERNSDNDVKKAVSLGRPHKLLTPLPTKPSNSVSKSKNDKKITSEAFPNNPDVFNTMDFGFGAMINTETHSQAKKTKITKRTTANQQQVE